jgi:hypothetical protein
VTDKNTTDLVEENSSSFVIEGENEPYLGPSWAILMLVLYALKTIFPAEQFSFLWWFQMYIVAIVLGITVFTLLKRHKYFQLLSEKEKREG